MDGPLACSRTHLRKSYRLNNYATDLTTEHVVDIVLCDNAMCFINATCLKN